MNEHKYTAIVKGNDVTLLRMDILDPKPCKYYPKYKARRYTTCMCKPCTDKYIASQKSLGKEIIELPDGWKPF